MLGKLFHVALTFRLIYSYIMYHTVNIYSCCFVSFHQDSSGPWFNIQMLSFQYRKSHRGDKTILRPSYLHNGISYTGKMTSLYWIRALITIITVYPMQYAHSFVLLCLVSVLSLVDSPHKWPVMQSFGVFFHVNLNKLLNKQSSCQWFEIQWWSCDIVRPCFLGCNNFWMLLSS